MVAGAVIGAASDQYSNSQDRAAANRSNRRNAWIGEAQHDLVNRSQAIADRPYTPYTNPRVAGMSQNENMADSMARNASTFNTSRSYLDKAGSTIDGVSEWSTDTLNKYMNPYVGSVVDSTLKRENTAYQQRQNQLKGQAASVGAFGGDRATLLEAAETGKHLDTVGDITAKGYSDAYTAALGAWKADNQTKLAVSDAYRAVGGDISRLNSNQITDLLKTGQGDRLMRQMQLDVDYNQFVEQRDWDVNNLEPLFRATAQANGGPAEKNVRDNTATNVLGLASTLVGYFGSRGGGTGGSTGGTGAGGGTAAPVAGYGGSGMGDYFGGGNSGTMLG